MNKNIFFIFLVLVVLIYFFYLNNQKIKPLAVPQKSVRTWQIKSIDTMKYSRDLAQEKLNDPLFDNIIDDQIRAIRDTGANYVAIATPYDERFFPILNRWVQAARIYNLSVWFRGNFSGWEGWFGQPKNLTREEHRRLTSQFIQNHPDLFRDGDIFTPCPECENGGPGDPRSGGDVASFRKFMIDEHIAAGQEFQKIGKKVATNIVSMNYDVAVLVFDDITTHEMGAVIAVDHYVKTPEKLAQDIDELSSITNAKVFLGEMGVPVPEITGYLDSQKQADWLDEALRLLAKQDKLMGLNYWVSHGGSTAIFESNNSPKPAAEILKKYFSLTNLI